MCRTCVASFEQTVFAFDLRAAIGNSEVGRLKRPIERGCCHGLDRDGVKDDL